MTHTTPTWKHDDPNSRFVMGATVLADDKIEQQDWYVCKIHRVFIIICRHGDEALSYSSWSEHDLAGSFRYRWPKGIVAKALYEMFVAPQREIEETEDDLWEEEDN
jgi:hypothetical protein